VKIASGFALAMTERDEDMPPQQIAAARDRRRWHGKAKQYDNVPKRSKSGNTAVLDHFYP